MRPLSMTAVMALVLVGSLTLPMTPVASVAHAREQAKAHVSVHVDGMTFASCTFTVRTAAKSVEGVVEARADVGKKRAWVRYDAKRTNPAEIAAAITRAGYTATPLQQ